MSDGWFYRLVMLALQVAATVFAAIQAFPELKSGIYFSLGEIIFYLLVASVLFSVGALIFVIARRPHHHLPPPPPPPPSLPYPDLRTDLESYRQELAQSRADAAAQAAELTTIREEVERYRAKETQEINAREALAEKLRAAPKLWVKYKPKDPVYGAESFVFSKDGEQTIVNIKPGPLVWNLEEKRVVTFLNNVEPVRTQPVECRISVHEVEVRNLKSIPDFIREIMKKYETTASPSMILAFETPDGQWFEQTYDISIDPYDKIVIKPLGPPRIHDPRSPTL